MRSWPIFPWEHILEQDTWSEWKLALLKCGRIENFMEELNNKQNTESDRSKNCWIVKSTEINV